LEGLQRGARRRPAVGGDRAQVVVDARPTSPTSRPRTGGTPRPAAAPGSRPTRWDRNRVLRSSSYW